MDINYNEFPIDLNLYPSDTQPPSSSGPLLFGHLLPPPPPPPPLILSDTPWSCPFPFLYNYELPPLLSASAPSSGPFLFSPLVPPTPLLLPEDTPSSGSFVFSPPPPPPLSPLLQWEQLFPLLWRLNQGEWLSNQASQRQQEPRRNSEEESWSSSEVVPSSSSLEQSTLTEKQIWEVLDKLKNQVYTGETCVICLEYFVPKEEVSVTPCNHMFHKKCLVPWVMQKGQCPHCRFVLFQATTNRGTGSSIISP